MAYVGASHEELVAAIKDLQRSDPEAKEQWIKYCATQGAGMRDPTKHDAEFLQNFFNIRETIEVPVHTDMGLAELFKEAQRASPGFKQAWSAYRSSMGGKYDDPAKHDESFLVSALEFLGQAACANMTMGRMCSEMMGKGGGKGGCKGSGWGASSWGGSSWGGGGWDSGSNGWEGDIYGPNKRRRTESWNGGGSWNQPPQGKQALVDQVKAFQRSGEEQKQAWWAYAARNGEGKDPNRFEERQLHEFLVMQGWA
mmetsp:Transcript_100350/g.259579  ORF Transcript_100350/g.259579 Transcript_100350/m.259579 type:complete len:254 (+) Transcript_100350:84-845(+)